MAIAKYRYFVKIVSLIFIFAVNSKFSNAQTSCSEIKKMKITYDFSTPEEFTPKFYKLQECGFDSIDCEIASTLAIMILFKKTEEGVKSETTYGEVISQLMKFKQSPLYTQARNETIELIAKPAQNTPAPVIDYSTLCDVPLYKDTFDSFGNLPQYFSYNQALKCAQSKGKLLFVYFTGHASASARKIEDDVLVDPEIQKLLTDNFIIVSLFVDHRGPIGKENLTFQERLGSLGQPAFYGFDNQEKVIDHHMGYTNKETFLKFLHSLVEKK